MSGEDWSEKLAERFAHHLGLPHARYEMARYDDEHGVVTPRITSRDQRLVHGNELLVELDPDYEEGSTHYRTPLHTVDAVFNVLTQRGVSPPRGHLLPPGVETCADVLTGYLLLDALIGNTDRHHENWAVVEDLSDEPDSDGLWLCPTFDHASSLGRNELVAKMEQRLATKDRGFTVEAYASRARCALYSSAADQSPLTPLEAVTLAGAIAPSGLRGWCTALAGLDRDAIKAIVELVPQERMPDAAKTFVMRMVEFNRTQLEDLCQSL